MFSTLSLALQSEALQAVEPEDVKGTHILFGQKEPYTRSLVYAKSHVVISAKNHFDILNKQMQINCDLKSNNITII